MLLPRVIPCLLMQARGLVKTRRFKDPVYVGDPINAIRIFNDKEVDELMLLDIAATREGRGPDTKMISQVTGECFMPLAYGGGISTLEQIQELFRLGVEKVVLNTRAITDASLVQAAADRFGSQSVVVSMDVRRQMFGGYRVYTQNGSQATSHEPVAFAERAQRLGAGELLVTSIDREGTLKGFDLELVKRVSSAVDIPVVASGGAGSVQDLTAAVREGGASAVSAGSLFVFQGPLRAVLISFPKRNELEAAFGAAGGVRTVA